MDRLNPATLQQLVFANVNSTQADVGVIGMLLGNASRRMRKVRMTWISGAILLLTSASCIAQLPASNPEWSDWVRAASCGEATYFVSITKDDGRNDFQLKVKVKNGPGHFISTKFDAELVSETGETISRKGNSRVRQNSEIEASPMTPSFFLGTPFMTPVNQTLPVHVSKIVFKLIETAEVDVPPKNIAPGAYVSDFRDYPKQTCDGEQALSFSSSPNSKFMGLTESCYNGLPTWNQAMCQAAVEELVNRAKQAPANALPCLRRWRAFQQCYEIYAMGPNPNPKPDCTNKVPACTPPDF
jgi:hypothetical protein